jgi:hypothetical protein
MKSEHNYPRGGKFPGRVSNKEKREREPVIIAGIASY